MRFLFYIFFLVFLLFPYLVFLPKIEYLTFIDKKEFLQAFWNTFLQSALSAFLCVAFGVLGGMSLLGSKHKKKLIFIFLTPTFLPSLYVLLSVMNYLNPFPFGLTGIVLVHTLIYMGLTAVMCFEIFNTKLSKFSELALLEGASRLQFLFVCLGLIKKDLLYVFLSLFIIFFSSFSIPLVVGKNTLIVETLIFEKIKIYGEYGHALAFTLIQSLFLFLLASFLRPSEKTKPPTFQRRIDLLKLPGLSFIFVILSCALLAGPLMQISFKYSTKEALRVFLDLQDWIMRFKLMTYESIWVSLSVGIGIYVLSLMAIFISDSQTFRKALLAYVAPSTALVGFALIILDLKFLGKWESLFKMTLGLSFLMLPMLYRFRLLNRFDALKSQIETAKTMGGSSFFIFRKITLPQIHKSVCFCAGLAGFWAASDFALSQFVFRSDETWSLFTYSLMNSYKLERASIFILVPIIIGGCIYFFFQGLYYVTRSKS